MNIVFPLIATKAQLHPLAKPNHSVIESYNHENQTLDHPILANRDTYSSIPMSTTQADVMGRRDSDTVRTVDD